MSRFVLPLVVLGLMPAFSLAGPNEFLAARTKNKAAFVVEAKTLKEVQPGAFLELKGRVAGNIKGPNGAASIIFKFGEETYIIESATTPAWLDLGVSDRRDCSRLGCQIELTEELDGLTVDVPPTQP